MSPNPRNTQHATRKLQPLANARFHIPFNLYRSLLFTAVVAYTVIFTHLAFDLHTGMRTHRSDLGQIAQAVWNSSQGRFVEMTDYGFVATRMADHVEPILALISPVLWIWRDVRALLLLQVLLVAGGAWPLYELALRRFDTLLTPRERTQIWQIEPLRQMTQPLALALAIAYLLTPQLQSAVLTEFHAVPLAVPFLLWAFWAVDSNRPWQFAIATLLIAVTKEEMALLAAGLAAWAIWRNWLSLRRASKAHSPFTIPHFPFTIPVALLCLSLLWFYLATFVIVPAHAGQVYGSAESVYFARYGALGDSPFDIAKSFVTQPQRVWQIATEPARLAYLWGLLAPFGLFTLLAPEIFLLALPLLLANLLSAYPAQYYGEFHYSAPLVPYLAVSAAYGLARLWRWIGRRTAGSSAGYQHMAAADTGVMAFVSLLTNARTALRPLFATLLVLWLLTWATLAYVDAGRGPGGARYDPRMDSATAAVHARLLPHFVAQIPADAAVTATAAVHPHLSLRRYIYQFPLGLPEVGTAGHADWALLDVTTNTDMAPGDVKTTVDTMLMGEWGVVDGADGFLLLRRGVSEKRIPAAFYDFARTRRGTAQTDPVPTVTQLVDITTLDWPRWRQTKIVAEWSVGVDVQVDPFLPSLTLVSPDGEPLHDLTTAAPPALIWYPPNRWQPGESVRLTTLALSLPALWGVVTANDLPNPTSPMQHGFIVADDQQQTRATIFYRTAQGVTTLPAPTGAQPFAASEALSPLTVQFAPIAQLPTRNTDSAPTNLTLQAWGMPTAIWPGGTFPVWLRWRGDQWPAGKTVFVHLRLTDENGTHNVVQRDGMPRFFVYYDANEALAARGLIEDTRQLTIPPELPVGTTLSLVVGLYDVESGERAGVLDMSGNVLGNEWHVAELAVETSPVPDQTCAMVPATCMAQQ